MSVIINNKNIYSRSRVAECEQEIERLRSSLKEADAKLRFSKLSLEAKETTPRSGKKQNKVKSVQKLPQSTAIVNEPLPVREGSSI